MISLLTTLFLFLFIPFGPLQVVRVDSELLFVVALEGMFLSALLLENEISDKVSRVRNARTGVQMLNLKLLITLALLSPGFVAGTFNFEKLVNWQLKHHWLVFYLPVNFAVFLIYTVEKLKTITKFYANHSRGSFVISILGKYANITLMALVASVIFLGGWSGPFSRVPFVGITYEYLKAGGILVLTFWFKKRFPYLRFDQALTVNWKILLPASLINLLVIFFLKLFVKG